MTAASFFSREPSGEDSLTDFRLIRIRPRAGGRPEVDREKLSSHLRSSAGENLQKIQLVGSSMESPAFPLFIWRRRAVFDGRKGAKLYRARERAYLLSSAPENSFRLQIKRHSPAPRCRCSNCTMCAPKHGRACARTYSTARSVRNFVEYLLTPAGRSYGSMNETNYCTLERKVSK